MEFSHQAPSPNRLLNIRTGLALILAFATAQLPAQAIPVRHLEGRLRGFVTIRSLDGKPIGYGELSQSAQAGRVTDRMTYRFRDGSLDEETIVFSEAKLFTLLSDRHLQRGPLFPHPIDLATNAAGDTISRTPDSNGKYKVETSHFDLPPGTAVVGMMGTLMANLDPATQSLSVPALSPSQKPRLLHFSITREGRGTFHIAGSRQTASIFRAKAELGGIAGLVAPILGKEPLDSLIWVLEGDSPVVVRAITQISEGGPLLDMQLAGATFPRAQQK